MALITFTSEPLLEEYLSVNELPFPVLLDPQRSAYRAFGLGRGAWTRVWGLRAARRYMEIVRATGWRDLRRPSEDTLQLGGDFVIAPDGTLAWGFWGAGPDDRPGIDDLVAAVDRAQR